VEADLLAAAVVEAAAAQDNNFQNFDIISK
jgi:hypothetical protein